MDGGWCCVENVDFVGLDYFLELVGIWICWYVFENDFGSIVGQWIVGDVGMICYLVDVGCILEDIIWFDVEGVFYGQDGMQQIVVGGVLDIFWFVGGIGCVEQEEWVFGFDLFWFVGFWLIG